MGENGGESVIFGVSPAFWVETGVELRSIGVKLCWHCKQTIFSIPSKFGMKRCTIKKDIGGAVEILSKKSDGLPFPIL